VEPMWTVEEELPASICAAIVSASLIGMANAWVAVPWSCWLWLAGSGWLALAGLALAGWLWPGVVDCAVGVGLDVEAAVSMPMT